MLGGIDLNLLVVFKSIYETRSISKTALILGLTQPTISHSLKRLRETFDDELFIRSSRSMLPTKRADELGPFISQKLNEIEKGIFTTPKWEPQNSSRVFTICGTGFDSASWFPHFLESIKLNYPKIDFVFKSIHFDSYFERLYKGEVDIGFTADLPSMAGYTIKNLREIDFVVIARKDLVKTKKLSFKNYLSFEHILYTPTEKGESLVDKELFKQGHRRRIALKTPYLNTIAQLVERTDLLCIVPRDFAQTVSRHYKIVCYEVPFKIKPFNHQIIWHQSKDNSLDHKWLREILIESYHQLYQ